MAEKKDTLCWTCMNAVPDINGAGCRWSRRGKPIDGWTADYIEKSCAEGSYMIKECPEYIKDTGEVNLDTATGECLQNLANAIVISAARDFRSLCKTEARSRAVPGNMTRRVLYRGKWAMLYGHHYTGTIGRIRRAERFFQSEYARSLTDADPEYIMEEIKKEEGL